MYATGHSAFREVRRLLAVAMEFFLNNSLTKLMRLSIENRHCASECVRLLIHMNTNEVKR